MYLAAWRYFADTPQEREAKQEYLHDLDLAPFGDKVDDLRNEVKNLSVPDGPKFPYFHNRKGQVNYFLGDNTNWPSMELAVDDLKRELAAYKKELASIPAAVGPVAVEENAHVLELTSRVRQAPAAPGSRPAPAAQPGDDSTGFPRIHQPPGFGGRRNRLGHALDLLQRHDARLDGASLPTPMHPPVPQPANQNLPLTPSP